MSHKPADYDLDAESPGEHIRNARAVLDTFYTYTLPKYLPTPDTLYAAKLQLSAVVREVNVVLQAVRVRLEKAEKAYEAERNPGSKR